jgi:SAM-dependent methyltransferase
MAEIIQLDNINQNQSWCNVESSGMIDIISKYNLAKVLTALYKTGIVSHIKTESGIDLEEMTGFNKHLLSHLLRYLKIHGILTTNKEKYLLTSHGKAILSDESIAQLCFYSEAYENVTSNIDNFLTDNLIYGKDIIRDGKALGIHCDTLFKQYHTPSIMEAIQGFNCKKVIDIGCGGGQFLIDICQENEYLQGIGLDISQPAIDYANEASKQNNLAERLRFVVADAFNLSSWPQECFQADILCGSGVVHEHFRDGEDAVITILNTYSKLLKENGFKAIILGEPEIRHDLIKSDSDLFLVHIFTAQGFPRHREEWLKLFPRTSLKCDKVYTRLDAGPRFNFFVLTLK